MKSKSPLCECARGLHRPSSSSSRRRRSRCGSYVYTRECGGRREREILITAAAAPNPAVGLRDNGWGWCENAITRIVCVCVRARAEPLRVRARRARIITKYRELIKHIVGARRLDNRYKLPPRAKQLTGETRAYSMWRRPIPPLAEFNFAAAA